MTGRRSKHHALGATRLYAYEGKRKTTYYTITKAGQYVNLGHELRAAKRTLLEMEEGKAVFPGTLAALIDEYQSHLEGKVTKGKRAARSVDDDKDYAKNLSKVFGHMKCESLNTSHCFKYLTEVRAEAPVRANKEIRWLGGAYRWGVNTGKVKHNPVTGVVYNEEVPRDRYVSNDELNSWLEWLSKEPTGQRVGVAFALAYLCCKAEAQVLSLNDTQFTAEGIDFGRRKGGADSFVQWTPLLKEVVGIAVALRPAGSTHVVTNEAGKPYTLGGFKALWQRRMVAWSTETKHPRFTFHDMRAKAVTDMKTDGRLASELSGHRQERIVAQVYDRRRVRKARAVR